MNYPLIGGAVACAAALLYGAFSLRLKKRVYKTHTDKVKNELRIAQISDLHDCLFKSGQSGLIHMLAGCKPDLIFLTGDIVEDNTGYVTRKTILSPDHPARQLIEGAVKIAPVYMVFGNHEANIPNVKNLRREIESLGVRFVSGETVHIVKNGDRFTICGMEDPYFLRLPEGETDPDSGDFVRHILGRLKDDYDRSGRRITAWREIQKRTFTGTAREENYSLLLSHRPEEYGLYHELGFDAVFSGHAHGGQWRLPPFINGLYAPHQGFFPCRAGGCYRKKSDRGEFVHVVSRGLSKKRFPRIFNRPEICLLEVLPMES